jgi:hypothetical protein
MESLRRLATEVEKALICRQLEKGRPGDMELLHWHTGKFFFFFSFLKKRKKKEKKKRKKPNIFFFFQNKIKGGGERK